MSRTRSASEITEEVSFYRDWCGWSEKHIEEYLDLAEGTLAQRRRRADRRSNACAQTEDLP